MLGRTGSIQILARGHRTFIPVRDQEEGLKKEMFFLGFRKSDGFAKKVSPK